MLKKIAEATAFRSSCVEYGNPKLQSFDYRNRFKCAYPSTKGSQLFEGEYGIYIRSKLWYFMVVGATLNQRYQALRMRVIITR